VGTARSKLKQFEQELLKDDFEKIRPEVESSRSPFPAAKRLTSCAGRLEGRRRRKPSAAAL